MTKRQLIRTAHNNKASLKHLNIPKNIEANFKQVVYSEAIPGATKSCSYCCNTLYYWNGFEHCENCNGDIVED